MSAVGDYLATLDGIRRERMMAVVAGARARPDVTEGIEWGMPTFRRGDAYFSTKSQKRYISLYLGCRPELCEQVAAGDPKLNHGKGCVNVTDSRPMPMAALEHALGELFPDG